LKWDDHVAAITSTAAWKEIVVYETMHRRSSERPHVLFQTNLFLNMRIIPMLAFDFCQRTDETAWKMFNACFRSIL